GGHEDRDHERGRDADALPGPRHASDDHSPDRTTRREQLDAVSEPKVLGAEIPRRRRLQKTKTSRRRWKPALQLWNAGSLRSTRPSSAAGSDDRYEPDLADVLSGRVTWLVVALPEVQRPTVVGHLPAVRPVDRAQLAGQPRLRRR